MRNSKQKKRISDPWFSELQVWIGSNYVSVESRQTNKPIIVVNLCNSQTGELRTKRVTVDQIARRLLESEIKTSGDIYLEDIEGKKDGM